MESGALRKSALVAKHGTSFFQLLSALCPNAARVGGGASVHTASPTQRQLAGIPSEFCRRSWMPLALALLAAAWQPLLAPPAQRARPRAAALSLIHI